jgi:hypothetical protein
LGYQDCSSMVHYPTPVQAGLDILPWTVFPTHTLSLWRGSYHVTPVTLIQFDEGLSNGCDHGALDGARTAVAAAPSIVYFLLSSLDMNTL